MQFLRIPLELRADSALKLLVSVFRLHREMRSGRLASNVCCDIALKTQRIVNVQDFSFFFLCTCLHFFSYHCVHRICIRKKAVIFELFSSFPETSN